MQRRKFLKTCAAAGLTAPLSSVIFLPAEAAWPEVSAPQEAQPPTRKRPRIADTGTLAAPMIWSAESTAESTAESSQVAPQGSGHASEIASSGGKDSTGGVLDRHSVFLKQIRLNASPDSALLHLFAYTRYRLYINGQYLGRGPNRFQNQRPEYDTRDIAGALRPGDNTLLVLVHRDQPTGRIMGHQAGFAAALAITVGGKTSTTVTGPDWLSQPDLSFGPRAAAWSSIEEHIDARRAVDLTSATLGFGQQAAGWARSVGVGGPEFFPVWPRSIPLQAEIFRSWAAALEHSPLPKLPIALGTEPTVFPLPEIIQGYHLLRFEALAGSEIEVAYQLPEDSGSGSSTYIARQGVQTWMGGDTFAFHRLSVRLKSGQVTLLDAQAVEVRYPFARVARFASSDPFLNRLWTLCARSTELLSEDAYVDCADRERVEWTDCCPPGFDCSRVMMRGPDVGAIETWADNRLLQNMLRRIALTQTPEGQLKAHSCSERWDIHAIMEDRSCDWVIQLREFHDSSLDPQTASAFVTEMWPTLTRLMAWFLARRTERGLVLARNWEVWDNPLRYQVCEGLGFNALVYRALRDAAYLGAAPGSSEAMRAQARIYLDAAAKLQADLNRLLWNPALRTYNSAYFGPGSKMGERLGSAPFTGPLVNNLSQPTAQGCLFALYSGIVPDDRVALARSWLLANLDQVTGIMSHFFLFDALYAMGGVQQETLALNRMRAGWKAQVESPWQTTWEALDGGGSKAHIYGIVPGYFLTAYVLGARRVGAAADRNLLIEPRCGDLAGAQGVAVTEFGPVPLAWRRLDGGGIALEVTVPAGTRAQLRLERIADSSTRDRSIRIDGRLHLPPPGPSTNIQIPLGPGSHAVQYPG